MRNLRPAKQGEMVRRVRLGSDQQVTDQFALSRWNFPSDAVRFASRDVEDPVLFTMPTAPGGDIVNSIVAGQLRGSRGITSAKSGYTLNRVIVSRRVLRTDSVYLRSYDSRKPGVG